MRFRELVADIYLLTLAYNGEAAPISMSQDYSVADKTMQLAGRLASIPDRHLRPPRRDHVAQLPQADRGDEGDLDAMR